MPSAQEKPKNDDGVQECVHNRLVRHLQAHTKNINDILQKVNNVCFDNNIFKNPKDVHPELDRYKCEMNILSGELSHSLILHTDCINRFNQSLLASPFPIPLNIFPDDVLERAKRTTVNNKSYFGDARSDEQYNAEEIEHMLAKRRAQDQDKIVQSLVHGIMLYAKMSPFRRHYGNEKPAKNLKLMMHCTVYRNCTQDVVMMDYFRQKLVMLSEESKNRDNGTSFERLHNLLSNQVMKELKLNEQGQKEPDDPEINKEMYRIFHGLHFK